MYRNEHQIFVAPVLQRDGLQIERVQRFDQTALLPEIDRWRAWSFRITLNGTRYVTHQNQAFSLAPNTILWHGPASPRPKCSKGWPTARSRRSGSSARIRCSRCRIST